MDSFWKVRLVCSSFFYLFIYLFIYLWLCWVFVSVRGLSLVVASGGPLFIAVHGPLTIAASLVAEHRLQMRRLSNCGSRAWLLRGMWDLPRPGLEPVSPALAGRFSTTAPPGKPLPLFLTISIFTMMCLFVTLFVFSLLVFIDLPGCVHSCFSVNLGSFQPLSFKKYLFLSLSSHSDTSIMYMLVYLMVFHISLKFYSPFFTSLFFGLHNLYWFIFKFSITSASSNVLLLPLANFSFQVLYFSALEFPLVLYYNFHLFINILYLVQ